MNVLKYYNVTGFYFDKRDQRNDVNEWVQAYSPDQALGYVNKTLKLWRTIKGRRVSILRDIKIDEA